jgi:two-component system chemotaxis response regulator CheY
MDLVSQSAEHCLITRLDRVKTDPAGWMCLYFSLSKLLERETVLKDFSRIKDRIVEATQKRDHFLREVQKATDPLDGIVYAFEDLDILVMMQAGSAEHKEALKKIYRSLSALLPRNFSDMGILADQMKSYQELADQKILTAQRQNSYRLMTDSAKIQSISSRRKRRDQPLIMMVEDDRFTAHYASTILSGEYDLILCKTAEEAIASYIEKAPDIVFMDIHLPGLSGHEAAQAISAVDKDAFIVMLSVDSVRDNVLRATQNGARTFLKKPYGRERMLETIKASPHVRALMRSTSVGHDTMLN